MTLASLVGLYEIFNASLLFAHVVSHHIPNECRSEPAMPMSAQHHLDLEPQIGNRESHSAFLNDEFETLALTPWSLHYKSCVQHFLKHGQYTLEVQSLAALINIRLPHQRISQAVDTSLRQYIRRLIVTAHDSPSILLVFFGGAWESGVACILKEERMNYLFAAKSNGWASTKTAYDILPDEQTPFLRPLRNPSENEIQTAEIQWSEWLAMQDWMVGERSPW
jgi:hypothetical protein